MVAKRLMTPTPMTPTPVRTGPTINGMAVGRTEDSRLQGAPGRCPGILRLPDVPGEQQNGVPGLKHKLPIS